MCAVGVFKTTMVIKVTAGDRFEFSLERYHICCDIWTGILYIHFYLIILVGCGAAGHGAPEKCNVRVAGNHMTPVVVPKNFM